MDFAHLVVSGCSFTAMFNENHLTHWPGILVRYTNAKLYNRAIQGASNGWISRSIIFQCEQLLSRGVAPSQILMIPMWSGIDRRGFFISKYDTLNYENITKNDDRSYEPVNFIFSSYNNIHPKSINGWLEGSNAINFSKNRSAKLDYRNAAFEYCGNEILAIESYESFLTVQWYCSSKNIELINLTYSDIMHYPNSKFTDLQKTGLLTKDIFRNVTHLYEMLDLTKWIFYGNTGGLFEYVANNNLPFNEDKSHPSPEAHKTYVQDFLIPEIQRRGINITT